MKDIMTGLSNVYIEGLLRSKCCKFVGVYSCNNLPDLNRSCMFSLVCNLSEDDEPGTHFITILHTERNIIYIDPFGHPCENEKIQTFIRSFDRAPIYNETQIQDYESSFCGFYAILFCLYFEHPESVVLRFNRRLANNDNLCIDYITQLLSRI